MYLFQPRNKPAETSPAGVDAGQASLSPFGEALPALSDQVLEAGSAAEWAIGELLIRLCNGGRALRPEPPETPSPE